MRDVGGTETDGWYHSYFEHPLPRLPFGFPNGWMSATDLRVLYNAALGARGDVLEVGPWLGRSTTALAAGLRDRAQGGSPSVCFDTIDFGITSAAEWQARFGQPLSTTKDKGRAIEAVCHPGGTIAVLISNLKTNELLQEVTNIVRGDLMTCPIARDYSLIFCDAVHDEAESRRHLPRLAELARPGAVFVLDDVVTRQHAELVADIVGARRFIMTRSLYPSPKKRCKLMIAET